MRHRVTLIEAQAEPIHVWRAVRDTGTTFDPRVPRPGYIVTYSSSPHVAASYGPEAKPYTLHGQVIEFPVSKDRHGLNRFDKVGFDQRALRLGKGQILVARDVVDIGPDADVTKDPKRLYSYGSDIYATRDPDVATPGHGSSLTEAFDHPYPYRWLRRGTDKVAQFTLANGVAYRVAAYRVDPTDPDYDGLDIGVDLRDMDIDDVDVYELSFGQVKADAVHVKITLTPLGDQTETQRIFATVIAFMKEMALVSRPDAFVFSAMNSEPSRVRLYRTFVLKAPRALPDFVAGPIASAGHLTTFTLVNRDFQRRMEPAWKARA